MLFRDDSICEICVPVAGRPGGLAPRGREGLCQEHRLRSFSDSEFGITGQIEWHGLSLAETDTFAAFHGYTLRLSLSKYPE